MIGNFHCPDFLCLDSVRYRDSVCNFWKDLPDVWNFTKHSVPLTVCFRPCKNETEVPGHSWSLSADIWSILSPRNRSSIREGWKFANESANNSIFQITEYFTIFGIRVESFDRYILFWIKSLCGANFLIIYIFIQMPFWIQTEPSAQQSQFFKQPWVLRPKCHS